MRWCLLITLLSCAHAPQPTEPVKTEPAKTEAVKPEPAVATSEPDARPCATPANEFTLAPLPAAELNKVGKDDFITLHRGACFGRCPMYSVTVHADGRVIANGERFVAQTGELTWNLDASVAKRLLAEFIRLHAWALDPQMSVHVTDLPTARLEGKLGAHTLSVKHYGAGSELSMGYANRDAETATRLERLIEVISEAETRVVCAPTL